MSLADVSNVSTATTIIDPILARVKMVPWVAPARFRDTSAVAVPEFVDVYGEGILCYGLDNRRLIFRIGSITFKE